MADSSINTPSVNSKCIRCGGPKGSNSRYCSFACRSLPECSCKHCGIKFVPTQGDRTQYCTRACSYADKTEAKISRDKQAASLKVDARCKLCGVPLSRPYAKHCGKCYIIHRRKMVKARYQAARTAHVHVCRQCDTLFESFVKNRAFCTKTCNRKYFAHLRRIMANEAFVEHVSLGKLIKRDGGICKLCDKPVDQSKKCPHRDAPTIDHITPISKSGKHSYQNTQLAHYGCNSSKRDKLPEELVA